MFFSRATDYQGLAVQEPKAILALVYSALMSRHSDLKKLFLSPVLWAALLQALGAVAVAAIGRL